MITDFFVRVVRTKWCNTEFSYYQSRIKQHNTKEKSKQTKQNNRNTIKINTKNKIRKKGENKRSYFRFHCLWLYNIEGHPIFFIAVLLKLLDTCIIYDTTSLTPCYFMFANCMQSLKTDERIWHTGCPRMFYTQKCKILRICITIKTIKFGILIGPYYWLSGEFWIKEIDRIKLKIHDIM